MEFERRLKLHNIEFDFSQKLLRKICGEASLQNSTFKALTHSKADPENI